jgi:hypothetical protein
MVAGAVVLALFGVACLPPQPAVTPPASTTAAARPSPTQTSSPSPTPTPSPTATPTPAPSPYVSTRGTITVDQPRAFAVVTSPLSVSGSAVLVEGAFSWRLLDLSGKELAKGQGQTSAGAPARGSFSLTVTFSVPVDTYAYLSVFNLSLRDGSVEDEARVPLTLAAR